MSEILLDLDEAKNIVTRYVFQKEGVPLDWIKVIDFKPDSWSGIRILVFRVKIDNRTIDATTGTYKGIIEERRISIWITADIGKIVGYVPDQQRQSTEQQSDLEAQRLERELKQSQLERNQAETQRLRDEEEIHWIKPDISGPGLRW
jgi:hypothetical protein